MVIVIVFSSDGSKHDSHYSGFKANSQETIYIRSPAVDSVHMTSAKLNTILQTTVVVTEHVNTVSMNQYSTLSSSIKNELDTIPTIRNGTINNNTTTSVMTFEGTTTDAPRRCFCPCKKVSGTSSNVEEISNYAVKIMEAIKVNKTKLSSHIRKRVCAYDSRTSSKVIGTIASLFLVSVLVLLILNDIHSFIIRRRNMKVHPVRSKDVCKCDDVELQNEVNA